MGLLEHGSRQSSAEKTSTKHQYLYKQQSRNQQRFSPYWRMLQQWAQCYSKGRIPHSSPISTCKSMLPSDYMSRAKIPVGLISPSACG
jgi:hypothetical protein